MNFTLITTRDAQNGGCCVIAAYIYWRDLNGMVGVGAGRSLSVICAPHKCVQNAQPAAREKIISFFLI